jgi:hypothetical protein
MDEPGAASGEPLLVTPQPEYLALEDESPAGQEADAEPAEEEAGEAAQGEA